jgi:hypothetical protein
MASFIDIERVDRQVAPFRIRLPIGAKRHLAHGARPSRHRARSVVTSKPLADR